MGRMGFQCGVVRSLRRWGKSNRDKSSAMGGGDVKAEAKVKKNLRGKPGVLRFEPAAFVAESGKREKGQGRPGLKGN